MEIETIEQMVSRRIIDLFTRRSYETEKKWIDRGFRRGN